MRIDPHRIIAGQPIRKIRDFLKFADDQPFTPKFIVWRLGADLSEALLAEGLIEPASIKPWDDQPVYIVSRTGRRLALTRFVPRISRATGLHIVEEFLRRVREVNSTKELLSRVSEAYAFGSLITNAPDLGDVDLAIKLERKPFPNKDWIRLNIERSLTTPRHRNFVQRIWYGDTEIYRLLTNRSRYISLHSYDELEQLGCASKRIYP